MENSVFILCNCGSHGILVEKDEEFNVDDVEISFWAMGGEYPMTLKDRIRYSLHILKYGKPYSDMVILNKESKKKLIKTLEKI